MTTGVIVGLTIAGVGLAVAVLGLCVKTAGAHELSSKDGDPGDPVFGCAGVVLGQFALYLGGAIPLVGVAVACVAAAIT